MIADILLIPDSEVVLVPSEPNLQVMVVGNDLKKVVFEYVRLAWRHAVDMSMVNLASCAEERLPACHWIGAYLPRRQQLAMKDTPSNSYHWMTGSEV